MLPEYEKLGSFYLGKKYDLAERKLQPELINYDSKDLDRSWVGNNGCVGIIAVGKFSKSQLVSSQSSDASDGSFSNPHLHSLFGKIATVSEVPDFGFRHRGHSVGFEEKNEIGYDQRKLFIACSYSYRSIVFHQLQNLNGFRDCLQAKVSFTYSHRSTPGCPEIVCINPCAKRTDFLN